MVFLNIATDNGPNVAAAADHTFATHPVQLTSGNSACKLLHANDMQDGFFVAAAAASPKGACAERSWICRL